MFSLETAAQMMATALPAFVRELGIVVESLGREEAQLRLPHHATICREGGIVSGQALASLADTSMLFAVWAALGQAKPVGTIDLHVSYLRPAGPADVLAHAEVVRLGRTLAFTRVTMANAASQQPVATAVATFSLPA